jgi:hypothetical protein
VGQSLSVGLSLHAFRHPFKLHGKDRRSWLYKVCVLHVARQSASRVVGKSVSQAVRGLYIHMFGAISSVACVGAAGAAGAGTAKWVCHFLYESPPATLTLSATDSFPPRVLRASFSLLLLLLLFLLLLLLLLRRQYPYYSDANTLAAA